MSSTALGSNNKPAPPKHQLAVQFKDGGNEASGRLQGGCPGERVYFGVVEDPETTEASWELDDFVVGGEGTGRGAEDKEGAVEHLIQVIPRARQSVRLEAALEVTEVVQDALPKKEKSRLKGEERELGEEELFWADSSPEKLDTVASDVVDVVDGRLECVERERGVIGGKELGHMSDCVGIAGEDDNVVEVGKNNRTEKVRTEDGEVRAETRESVADGKGEEEKERESPSRTPERIHSQVVLIDAKENDGRVRSVRPPSYSPKLRTVLLGSLGTRETVL
jgi:hypothetical protein